MPATTDISKLLSDLSLCKTSTKDKPEGSTRLSWGPIEHLAYYSCDSDQNITYDTSCLHTFSEPAVPANLTKGKNQFYTRHRNNRLYGHPVPLSLLVNACVAFNQQDKLREADVVAWRGVLVKYTYPYSDSFRIG